MKASVESFQLDHTKLGKVVPYIRESMCVRGIVKYDFRIKVPNNTEGDYLSNTEIHSIEHYLATYLREILGDSLIDVSPMGCQTGFYLTFFLSSKTDINSVKKALSYALTRIVYDCEPVPANNKIQCGHVSTLNVGSAAKIAFEVLSQGINIINTKDYKID